VAILTIGIRPEYTELGNGERAGPGQNVFSSINYFESFREIRVCFSKEFKLWRVQNDSIPKIRGATSPKEAI
jgi:hypothetical protein